MDNHIHKRFVRSRYKRKSNINEVIKYIRKIWKWEEQKGTERNKIQKMTGKVGQI